MSIYLSRDSGEPTFLASNKGWGDFCRWAGQIGPQLAHLCNYGWCQQTKVAMAELQKATPSTDPNVATTAKDLAYLLDGDVVTINDGTGPDKSFLTEEN